VAVLLGLDLELLDDIRTIKRSLIQLVFTMKSAGIGSFIEIFAFSCFLALQGGFFAKFSGAAGSVFGSCSFDLFVDSMKASPRVSHYIH
jgi:hypothetical protein